MVTNVNKENLQNLPTSYIVFLNILICLHFAPFLIFASYRIICWKFYEKLFQSKNFLFYCGLTLLINCYLFIAHSETPYKPLHYFIFLYRVRVPYRVMNLIPKIWFLVFWIRHKREWDLGQ